jgi:PilZ domain
VEARFTELRKGRVAQFVSSVEDESIQSRTIRSFPVDGQFMVVAMHPSGIRRSNRIAKQIPVTLIGTDTDGKTFMEHTHTLLLSQYGASVVSKYKLSPEQELVLRWPDGNKEADVQIVGQVGTHLENYAYGVAFLDVNINFWDREFTQVAELEGEVISAALQCTRCGRQESVAQGDLELDVYAFNDKVIRYCKECGSSTIWKVSHATGKLTPANPGQVQEPSHPPADDVAISVPAERTAPEDKRQHRRMKVNLAACIRRPGFDDDVVICEDMSRGGLRFKSRLQYFADTTIEIAVPYTRGSSDIFVSAQILYVQELDKRGFYRCGAAYTKFQR